MAINPLTVGTLGAGAALIPSIRDYLFPNPADATRGFDKKASNILNKYYQPYVSAGLNALPELQNQFNELIKNPNALIERLGSGYTRSPGYEYRLNQGENAINNAAAAGGMIGTGQHQLQAGKLAEDLASEDFDKYFNNALKLYGIGLEGEQGLNTQGYGAAGDLATSLANLILSKANMDYAGQAYENSTTGGLLSGLVGLLKGG